MLQGKKLSELPAQDTEDILKAVKQVGYHYDRLIYESSLIDNAQNSIRKLEKDGLTKLDSQGRIRLKKQWIAFRGKAGVSVCPSCTMMDAIFYAHKLASSDLAINILPKAFQQQQLHTREILKAIGLDKPSILVIFFDIENAEIKASEYWGPTET